MATALLERDGNLRQLSAALTGARASGQVVALSGEAGIGKSSLLQAWAERERASATWLWGFCEALGTPRPLGPLLDVAPALGGRASAALAASAPRHDVFAAALADLANADGPVVLCVEDVHWADDATLDLLQFLARRWHTTRAVLALTWRADEVGVDHAIHRVLSAIVPAAVHRITPSPLSLPAIETLAGGRTDAATVLAVTRGNPFFVTELLQSSPDTVPASVRDAVLARRTRLDAQARSVLDLVAVVPSRIELAVLAVAAGPEYSGLERCVAGGLLIVDDRTAAFRHELARQAVAGALSTPRAQACHRRVLQALLAQPDRDAWLARIVHHAEGAGDVAAMLEQAPAAARQAATAGAHRQAVAHYQRALGHGSLTTLAQRLALTEALAYEHYLTGDISAAEAARRDALELAARSGEQLVVGRNTYWLSRLGWFRGDGTAARARADEAIAILERLPESFELGMAYSNRSQIAMLEEDYDACLSWGTRAIALARRLEFPDVLSHALNNVGTMRRLAGEPEGRGQLEESLQLALSHNLHEHVARAYTNIGSTGVEHRVYADARRALDAGLAYCAERDLGSWTHYMRATRARLRAETGLWQSAVEDADTVRLDPGAQGVARIVAKMVLGLIRVRRGDPGATEILEEALEQARGTGEPQRLIPILLARAEHAWWQGRRTDAIAAALDARAAVDRTRRSEWREYAWYWLWKAGALDADLAGATGPYASLMKGDWQSAAREWEHADCPYERGLALAEGDVRAVERALEVFHALGAAPAADCARQRLRELGVARVPRGKRATTLSHPRGLTTRETEVLTLMAEHLTNGQIGQRLFVSAKTVEHHVSAILGKLGVEARDAAVTLARRQGWIPEK